MESGGDRERPCVEPIGGDGAGGGIDLPQTGHAFDLRLDILGIERQRARFPFHLLRLRQIEWSGGGGWLHALLGEQGERIGFLHWLDQFDDEQLPFTIHLYLPIPDVIAVHTGQSVSGRQRDDKTRTTALDKIEGVACLELDDVGCELNRGRGFAGDQRLPGRTDGRLLGPSQRHSAFGTKKTAGADHPVGARGFQNGACEKLQL